MYPETAATPKLFPFSRNAVIAGAALLLLLFLALSVHSLILGNTTAITLPTAPPLTGAISQSLGYNADGTALVGGKDFRLSNVQYFDNNTWAAASVNPTSNNFDPSVVVLQKRQGTFQAVLGPASAFPNTQMESIPSDVAAYLQARVAVYQLVPGQ